MRRGPFDMEENRRPVYVDRINTLMARNLGRSCFLSRLRSILFIKQHVSLSLSIDCCRRRRRRKSDEKNSTDKEEFRREEETKRADLFPINIRPEGERPARRTHTHTHIRESALFFASSGRRTIPLRSDSYSLTFEFRLFFFFPFLLSSFLVCVCCVLFFIWNAILLGAHTHSSPYRYLHSVANRSDQHHVIEESCCTRHSQKLATHHFGPNKIKVKNIESSRPLK